MYVPERKYASILAVNIKVSSSFPSKTSRLGRTIGIILLVSVLSACTTASQEIADHPPLYRIDQISAPEALPWPQNATLPIVPALKPDIQVDETPPKDESKDLWALMRRSMHMDLHLDERRVQQELAWLKRNPNYLRRLGPRMQTYLPYIFREVALHDLPAELALLPIVESALDVYAFSHGGAAGPWQFIRGTARQYRLTMDDWYDGRRDIVASTDAAITLLTDLNNRFDDWFLALAAYNAGPGNVNRGLRKVPGGSYFELPLPRETMAYVPRLLALAAVIKTPEQFGLELPEIANEIPFSVVETHSQFQLSILADVIELPLEELQHWNPAFGRWATSPRGPHHLVIPSSIETEVAQSAIDAWPVQRRVDWKEIQIREGDTLSQIAARHKTDVRSLVAANNIRKNQIRAGQKLLIPASGTEAPPPTVGQSDKIHVVASGESLWTISRQYDVNLRKLMRVNKVGPRDPLAVGKKLVIPGVGTERSVVRTVRYKVRKGDSLARIASKFNVTIKQIAEWNSLDLKRYLQPGQPLKLYVNVIGG